MPSLRRTSPRREGMSLLEVSAAVLATVIVASMALDLYRSEVRQTREQQSAEQLAAVAEQVKVVVERDYGRLYTQLQGVNGRAVQLDWADLLAAGVEPPCQSGGSLVGLTCDPVTVNRAGIDVWAFCAPVPAGQTELTGWARLCDNIFVAAVTAGPVTAASLPRPTVNHGGFGRIAADGLSLYSHDRRLDLSNLEAGAGAGQLAHHLIALRHLGRQTDVEPFLNRLDHDTCVGCSPAWGFAGLNRMEIDLDMGGHPMTGLGAITVHDLVVTGEGSVTGDLWVRPGPDLDGDGVPDDDNPIDGQPDQRGAVTLPEIRARFDVVRAPGATIDLLSAETSVTLTEDLEIPITGQMSVHEDLDSPSLTAPEILAGRLRLDSQSVTTVSLSANDAVVESITAGSANARGVVADRLQLSGSCSGCTWR